MARLLGAVVSLLVLPLIFFLYKYLPYYLHDRKADLTAPIIVNPLNANATTSQRLKHLEELSALPIVGHFFLEDNIIELLRLNRLEDAVEKSGSAIESPLNGHSPQIWYYRALSQCLLKQLEDCELSLNRGLLYSNRHTQGLFEGVYTLLQQLSSDKQIGLGRRRGLAAKEAVVSEIDLSEL